MVDKLTRRLLGRGKPKTTALRDVAPNIDVDALLKRGDLATLASASRELEMKARAAFAGFVEDCRMTISYDDLKNEVKEDLKAVAALLKQRGDLDRDRDRDRRVSSTAQPKTLESSTPGANGDQEG